MNDTNDYYKKKKKKHSTYSKSELESIQIINKKKS